jgi:hypothetical protein
MAFKQKLLRFLRKPPREKWLAVRVKLREFVNKPDPTQALILHTLKEIHEFVRHSSWQATEQWLEHEFTRERYADGKRLEPSGFKVYSQNDEDGMIQEIFRRIGTQNQMFVEFGVENGLENNTLKLLLEGWRGLWIECNAESVVAIRHRFSDVLADNRLAIRDAFITAENINKLIGGWHKGEIDLLSIDIDGNDFYIWQAINVITPRVVVIECNSKFPPPISIVQEYNPHHVSRGTDYFGASLEALTRLGARLDYSLVGTNLQAANAFFVRNDLVDDKFQAPFSAENHYNNKAFVWPYHPGSGHPPDWGRWVKVD